MIKEKFLDVNKVIKNKNPALFNLMPGILLRYIQHIVHEDELNQIMERNQHLQDLEFIDALISEFGVDVELEGAENIPLTEPVIFVANHPLGGLDGIAFIHVLGKYRQDIKFLVNDILTNVKNVNSLFVPINKHGANAKEAIAFIEEAYAGPGAVLVFPAGLVSRKQKGGIKDLEWNKSFVKRSRRYKKDVVPVYIGGKNSNFFYNLAKIRKTLGIKANVEMFYLVDEMFAQKDKKVTIHIGKPISYKYFDSSKNDKHWAEVMKLHVYAMSRDND